MYERDYEERMKPVLWAIFLSAAVMRGQSPKDAAPEADQMQKLFEQRFPVKPEPDYGS